MLQDIKDIIKRDWLGLLFTAVSFGVFVASLYLISMNTYTINQLQSENTVLRHQILENKHLILQLDHEIGHSKHAVRSR